MFCCAVKSPFGPQAYLMSVVSYNIMSPIEGYGMSYPSSLLGRRKGLRSNAAHVRYCQ
jgi:hypothetical protein